MYGPLVILNCKCLTPVTLSPLLSYSETDNKDNKACLFLHLYNDYLTKHHQISFKTIIKAIK